MKKKLLTKSFGRISGLAGNMAAAHTKICGSKFNSFKLFHIKF